MPRVVRTLGERLWDKVDRNGPIPPHQPALGPCWIFRGALSQSGQRAVWYGAIREGGPDRHRVWRVPRLVLVLTVGPVDVPPDDHEDFFVWLGRARRFYDDLEAGHQCDNSQCANPDHLEWESHTQNLIRQKQRQRAAKEARA